MPRQKKPDLAAMERRIKLQQADRALDPNRRFGPSQYVGGKCPLWVPRTKVIICGTRDFDDYRVAKRVLDKFTFWMDCPEVVLGSHGTKVEKNFEHVWVGGDAMGYRWAEWYGWTTHTFWPDWDAHGKAAGPIRNRSMAEFAAPDGYCVCFWDQMSKGTENMIHEFLKRNPKKHLKVCRYE